MEPTAVETATTGTRTALEGGLLVAIGGALAKIISGVDWGRFIGRPPKSKPVTRREVEGMIKEHDETATTKTTLMLRDHEKSCLSCIDKKFTDHLSQLLEIRREDLEERRESRRELNLSIQRIHDRIDSLAGR